MQSAILWQARKQEFSMKNGPFDLRIFFRVLMMSVMAGMICLYQPAFASGTNRYVDTTGLDTDNDCATRLTPCQTIAYTISRAASGDMIRIAAGSYSENLSIGKDLKFYGAGMNATIIDGGGSNRVIFTGECNLAFNDMTIQNGNTTFEGGGITSTRAPAR
jgi:hypothetical protein